MIRRVFKKRLNGESKMFKYIVQLIVGIIVLIGSTLAALYEGSNIVTNSLEWGYSTPFTNLLGISIDSGSDISKLDYLVYAAKFHPFFPALMEISFLYMFAVLIFLLRKINLHYGILLSVTVIFLLTTFGYIFYSATASGAQVLFWVTVLGILTYVIMIVLFIVQRKKK
jgi:hypothetical protein